MSEILIINFAKGASHTGKTLAKFEMKKQCVWTVRNVRKISKGFGRREGEVLEKKGCEEGGVSL